MQDHLMCIDLVASPQSSLKEENLALLRESDNQPAGHLGSNLNGFYQEWTNARNPGLALLPSFSLQNPFLFDPFPKPSETEGDTKTSKNLHNFCSDGVIDVSEKSRTCMLKIDE